jgi:hypothetical protein
MVIKD